MKFAEFIVHSDDLACLNKMSRITMNATEHPKLGKMTIVEEIYYTPKDGAEVRQRFYRNLDLHDEGISIEQEINYHKAASTIRFLGGAVPVLDDFLVRDGFVRIDAEFKAQLAAMTPKKPEAQPALTSSVPLNRTPAAAAPQTEAPPAPKVEVKAPPKAKAKPAPKVVKEPDPVDDDLDALDDLDEDESLDAASDEALAKFDAKTEAEKPAEQPAEEEKQEEEELPKPIRKRRASNSTSEIKSSAPKSKGSRAPKKVLFDRNCAPHVTALGRIARDLLGTNFKDIAEQRDAFKDLVFRELNGRTAIMVEGSSEVLESFTSFCRKFLIDKLDIAGQHDDVPKPMEALGV